MKGGITIKAGGATEDIAATICRCKTTGKNVATTGTVIVVRLKELTASNRGFAELVPAMNR
jgi:hypothetical protein